MNKKIFTRVRFVCGTVLVFGLLLISVVAGVLGVNLDSFSESRAPKEFEIRILQNGFSPSEVALLSGDTVVFKNESGSDAWPASDPHPTHEYLDGFDPRKPIRTGEQWKHTFTDVGTWRYHDHIALTRQGSVAVLDKNSKQASSAVGYTDMCDGKCFDEIIRTTVATKGIDAAFALFQKSFDEGNLPRGCHWTAHQIGEAAYELFREGKEFPISHATTYCAYGFYHGFMEGLLRENPDPQYALSFCEKVKEAIGEVGLQNCYHGIGHGYTEDPPDPTVWGNFNAMVEPGRKMCEFLFGKNFSNLNLCLTGVFTVPAGFADKGAYGLSMDLKYPFSYCADLPYRYLKACYGEFAPKLDHMLEWDITRLPAYVSAIPEEKLQRLVTWVVPSVMMARDVTQSDNSNYIHDCRSSFSGRLRKICWGGTILGIFTHGAPEKQYEKVFALCASTAWQKTSQPDDERSFCYGEGFRQMRQSYTSEKVQTLCASAPKEFQHLCFDEQLTHESPYDDPSFEVAPPL